MGWFEEFKKEWRKALNKDDATWMIARDAAAKPQPLQDLPGLEMGHFNDYAGLTITFPAGTSRKDFERMKAEIQAALDRAEHRGERKALAFLRGDDVGPPLGIVKQPELNNVPLEGDDGSIR